jgi:murein tripeptide amidase MpaA
MTLAFDRFLHYEELTSELHALASEHPELVALEAIGRSHEGREIWLATITDRGHGAPETKSAHWVDANIHAIEMTGGVAALYLIHRLVTSDDERTARALATRTFYVVPRVNPDGVELALSDRPRFLRSSVRPWPWGDAHVPPGLRAEDVDGDGRVLTMRLADPNGAWKPHPDEPRLLVRRPPDDEAPGPRYRLLAEGTLADYDGFTIPTPRPPEGLDLNRNFPAGWGKNVPGPGDYPGSEPEIEALLRAMIARPNICGYNAFHTSGGVLLRPSSMKPDRDLPPEDIWAWKRLGARCSELTGYPVHSIYEDFTWDHSKLMSGAADDWAYEHLGVFSWTTEFWDVIAAATGERAHLGVWVEGPTTEQYLSVLRWLDAHDAGELFVDWYPFDHPQLGEVELGGWDSLQVWANPPPSLLEAEVAPHAEFAVFQALAAPCVEILEASAEPLGDGTWRVRAGLANTGWLPTTVTERAAKETLVLPLVAELSGAEVIDVPARRELGQLSGRSAFELDGGRQNDGTPDRVLVSWVVRADAGATVTVDARHPRAGTASTTIDVR